MTDAALIIAGLRARWVQSMLSFLLVFAAVTVCVIAILARDHADRNLSGGNKADIVIGAKGSPLQLVLSTLYHIDIPPGNIDGDEMQRWQKHKSVKMAVPLALGDNMAGYRIVGTTQDYLTLYNARVTTGLIWQKPFDAVIGAGVAGNLSLDIGARFTGAHGLGPGGHAHKDDHYTVTGILAPTGTVIDRLILTPIETVQDIHSHGHDHDHAEHDITAILIKTRSPLDNMNLPRQINRESDLMAAVPAMETARLFSLFGVGFQTMTSIGLIVLALALFSIFAGLAGHFETRLRDLALLRALGFSRRRVFALMTGESMAITLTGLLAGFGAGHGFFHLLCTHLPALRDSGATALTFPPEEMAIMAFVILAGFLAGLYPSIKAAWVDPANLLSKEG